MAAALAAILLASCGGAAPPEGAELEVLQRAGEAVHCPGEAVANGARYRFTCVQATSHSLDAVIERFAGEAEARAAFDAARAGRALECFQGRAAYSWQYDEQPDIPAFPMRHRGHAWQAWRWLVTVQTFDDTHFEIAPEPEQVSQAIYEAAVAAGFFSKTQPTCTPD